MAAAVPSTRRVTINGLSYHLLVWNDLEHASAPVALLLHGAKDRGTSFDEVGPRLAAVGWAVFAPDLRGYGATEDGARAGGYQLEHFVSDIAELVETLSPGRPVFLVGHSFGGVLATLYAGAFPDRVGLLAIVEGLGGLFPDAGSPDRLRVWIQAVQRDLRRPPRRVSLEHAVRSLMALNPELSESVARRRADQLTIPTDDGRAWWFDALHWSTLFELSLGRWIAHATRIRAPILLVSGGPTGHHPSDEAERIAALKPAEGVEIANGGHMVHWSQPEALADALLSFARRRGTFTPADS